MIVHERHTSLLRERGEDEDQVTPVVVGLAAPDMRAQRVGSHAADH